MVRNHNEQRKRRISGMVIKYEKVSDATFFDGIKIPHGELLFIHIQDARWFTMFDAKFTSLLTKCMVLRLGYCLCLMPKQDFDKSKFKTMRVRS